MKQVNNLLRVKTIQSRQPRSVLTKSLRQDSCSSLSLLEKSNSIDRKIKLREKRIAQTLAKQLAEIIDKRPAFSPQRKKIFCIDDSLTIQFLVKEILSILGYQVIANTDPLKSLKHLLKEKPQLILMDIKMPGIGGHELLQTIKKSRKFQDIPTIMLTSQKRQFDRIRAKILGASAYITKPFSPQELIAVVEKVLSTSNLPPV